MKINVFKGKLELLGLPFFERTFIIKLLLLHKPTLILIISIQIFPYRLFMLYKSLSPKHLHYALNISSHIEP